MKYPGRHMQVWCGVLQSRVSDFFALCVLACLVFLKFWLQIFSCQTWLASDIGDNTSGLALWNVWEALRVSTIPAIAAPEGTDTSPQNVQTVMSGVARLSSLLLGAHFGLICGYNILVISLSILTTLAAYWLFRSVIGASPFLSILGSAMLGLGPFASFMLSTHVQWVGHFPLLLFLGFSLRLVTRPSITVGILAALSALATLVSEPHMPIAALVIALGVAIGAIVATLFGSNSLGQPSFQAYFRPLIAMGTTLLLGVAIFITQISRQLNEPGGLGLPKREDSDIWGVSAVDYLVGGLDSRVTSAITGERILHRISDDQVGDQYFVGFTLLLGVCLAVVMFIRVPEIRRSFSQRFYFYSALVLTTVGFLLSNPYGINIGLIEIPSLPQVIQLVLPSVRFFWRFLYIPFIALVALGVMGLNWWVQYSKNTRKRLLFASSLLAMFAIDLLTYRSYLVRGFNLEHTPNVYRWLAETPMDNNEYVAELVGAYPSYTTWQVIHGRPLVNDGDSSSRRFAEVSALNGFVHPQTPCIANALSARFLLRHAGGVTIPAFPGQKLVASFRFDDQSRDWDLNEREEYKSERFWYDVDVYENDGSVSTGIFMSYGPGFGSGTYDGSRGLAPMNENTAFVNVESLNDFSVGQNNGEWPASFDIRGGLEAQQVVIAKMNGEEIWRGLVGQDWQKIVFTSKGNEVIRIQSLGNTRPNPLWVGRFGVGDCL